MRSRPPKLLEFLLAFCIVVGAGTAALLIALPGGGKSSVPPPLKVRLAAAPSPVASTTTSASLAASSTTTTSVPKAVRKRRVRVSVDPVVPAATSWVDRTGLDAAVADVQAQTGAQVGVAVRPLGPGGAVRAGALQIGSGWSTMKVPVIMARYRLAAAHEQDTASFDADVVNAITESDNAAVEDIFGQIESSVGGLDGASQYVQQELQTAGDSTTQVNTTQPPGGFSTFGQTQWSLSAGTLFYRALADGCLAPTSGAARILGLMGQIIPSQSWGLGQTAFPGAARVLFKGGWGPAPPSGPYTVRQFAIVLTSTGDGFVVGLITVAADGSFTSGIDVLDRLAAAVARNTHIARAPTGGSC